MPESLVGILGYRQRDNNLFRGEGLEPFEGIQNPIVSKESHRDRSTSICTNFVAPMAVARNIPHPSDVAVMDSQNTIQKELADKEGLRIGHGPHPASNI